MEAKTAEMMQSLLPRKHFGSDQVWFNRVDGKEVIRELMLQIAGVEVRYTENGNVELVSGSHQIMTLEGASKLHTLLRTLINPVTSLTQFNEKDINFHTRRVSDELAVWFVKNYETYGINRSYVPVILSGLGVAIHAQLKRSLNGKEAEWVSAEHSRVREEGRMEQKVSDTRKGVFGK